MQRPASGQRHVDHGTVRGEGDHLPLDCAADGEGSDEVDEGQWLVDRGGGVELFFFEPVAWPALVSVPALPPLVSACFGVGVSFLDLALFGGAAFLADCFLAASLDLPGFGGCRASSTASSIVLENTGSTLAVTWWRCPRVDRPRRVDRGGRLRRRLLGLGPSLGRLLRRPLSSAALAGADSGSFFVLASAVAAAALVAPHRSRGVKIHPTPGTGLPPISRPLSNSHGCSPWNSWKESLDRTVAPVFSAIRSRKASPRPMAPAGGDTTSPLSIAWRTSSRSASETRWRGGDARRLGVSTLSQLAPVAPQLRLGVGYEFLERQDEIQGLVSTYELKFPEAPRVMDLGLLYRVLQNKSVDVVAGNNTDGLIAALGLVVLEDDKHYFPPYDAVPVVRPQLLQECPQARAAFERLADRITADDMRRMNYAVDGQKKDAAEVARDFLTSHGLLSS